MSRIWIYQADRFLSGEEVQAITAELNAFVSAWTAHGSALSGKGYILESLFVILEVDERVAGVTGCSIDKSVHFIKSLGSKFNIDFFDRMRVAYISQTNTVQVAARSEFEELVKTGIVTPDTIVFNNLINSSEEIVDKWKIPFKDSWHSRVFS